MLDLQAALDFQDWQALLPLGAVLTGLAVFLVAQQLLSKAQALALPGQGETFEQRRRDSLRKNHALYAALEPLVDLLASRYAQQTDGRLELIQRQLAGAGIALPWQPAEYLALRHLEGGVIGFFLAGLCYLATNNLMVSLLIGGVFGYLFALLFAGDPRRKAAKRLRELKTRLPYFLDLMAILMEAGSDFRGALRTSIDEAKGTPLGDEFAKVLQDTEMGRTRREALQSLQERLGDPDLNELIFAIIKGEEMGTPLAVILRNAADQALLRRTQQIEREAAEAQVAILFPGFLVMLACVLIIVAPFVLQAMNQKILGDL